MSERASEYTERRKTLNDLVLRDADLSMKRFFALDHDVYSEGALPKRVKELVGLAASTVLRCNDCISYHLIEATQSGVTKAEIIEALGIALVVGGSITIPHLRHAMAFLETIDETGTPGKTD
jgi:ribonuclease HI